MENSYLFGAMQVFISVADSGSFSESARRLGLSQPSISRQVNKLEEHLGVRLLQRTTRRLSLTEAGQVYYEKAQQIQRDVIEADQSISGFKDTPSGLLRISTPLTWAEILITPYLGEFLQRYPEVKIDIECNNTIQDIIEDRLDLVIRVGELKDSSYIAIPIANVRMVLCATPAYLKKFGTPKTAAELQNHNFICFEDYNQMLLNDGSKTQQVSVAGNISANTVSVMMSALQQHIGISVLPDRLIKELLQTGELVDIMPGTEISAVNLPVNQIFALYSNRKHLPAKVRALLDFLREKWGRDEHSGQRDTTNTPVYSEAD
ncbi:MAG: LysR substrate-binding domain-containing protein [Gammaproteobacteria bacterium]|nr:LysR substrate-binding domain-containing protein [Gammaproteobacteria bacterium]